MDSPPKTLLRLIDTIFADRAEREAFLAALQTPQPYAPALVWLVPRPTEMPFPRLDPFDWQPDYVDRVSIEYRPGQHPIHQQGGYYCLDISSVFTSCVLEAVSPGPECIVDLCASPGGKSILAWRRFHPRILLCNEVIKKRTAALIANLQRCKIRPSAVVSRDTSRLAETWTASADLVIVDTPCSGQSLIARGKPSPGCFHPATINLNANRQRRILANAGRLVAPGGFLAYITCTYSRKENEANLSWFLRRFPQFSPVLVPHLTAFQSHLSELPCYRLWPHSGFGAGGFASLLQNTESGSRPEIVTENLNALWNSQTA